MRRQETPTIYEQLEITSMASDGSGIARLEGMVVFVEFGVPGDIVDVQITKKKSGFRKGRILQTHQLSEKRTEPLCQHFGTCGGCSWQHISYQEQLKFKHQQVIDALQRIGKIELPEIMPILASASVFHYRNKLEFTFSSKRWLTQAEIDSNEEIVDRSVLGFHLPGRFDKLMRIEQCHLMNDFANKILRFTEEKGRELHIPFYDLRAHEGILRNLMLRSTQSGEWMVCLSVAAYTKEVEELLQSISDAFPSLTSLMYTVNTKKNDVWYDLDLTLFKGLDHISETMENLSFRIGPKSFYQTNPAQAERLYNIAREFADLSGNEIVYDLYTGTGTIAQFVASKAKKVIGIEFVKEAIEDADLNAQRNKIENAFFFAGDMKDILNATFFDTHGMPDVIITDPPRAGMHEDVVNCILASGAKRIVYVSCNPATQARDLALLDEKYIVTKVQPVDMFPQTTHVENVVRLDLRF